MKFLKMQGTGNDFVVLDGLQNPLNETDWPSLARSMCDRHFGIGSDGLLIVQPSDKADFRMRMLNPDGSESEMCGNGIRCFAKYVFDSGLTSSTDMSVETGAGVLALKVRESDGAANLVTVRMGVPEFRPPHIPVVVDGPMAFDLALEGVGAKVVVNCVSMGNPHAVMLLDAPVAEFPLELVGPKVEHHALFPRRINFEIVFQRSADELDVRVWERGAGLTLACGTGACAVTAIARSKALIGDNVKINLPGGQLELAWDGSGQIEMTGPAELVFEGHWPD